MFIADFFIIIKTWKQPRGSQKGKMNRQSTNYFNGNETTV